MAEHDLQAVIRKLAEARLPDGSVPFFASLRVAACTKMGSHWHHAEHYNPSFGKPCSEGWHPEPDVEKACWRLTSLLGIGLRNEPQGWSAVVLSTIPADSIMFVQRYSMPEEAVLRAAEAWLDAKMKEAQT